ncbi:MAG: VOC family protein [Planctomycetota bacterium]
MHRPPGQRDDAVRGPRSSQGFRARTGPGVRGVIETVLYGPDLDAAERFYGGVLGLPVVSRVDDLAAVFRVDDDAVLIAFNPAASSVAGRPVPAHGASGPGHVALRIERSAYSDWLVRLRAADVAIELEKTWETTPQPAARSIYIRDPAGNSVELLTGDIWPSAGR